ncbi:MAG: immunoglobulin domain-containing protein, partial [Verrucomicrobia bacterium]|nr:immunoglobulin domain-containing protein [Verrucomicrobiota bacterium]
GGQPADVRFVERLAGPVVEHPRVVGGAQVERERGRVLADEPVLLRPPVLLNDPATNLLFLRIVAAGAPPLTYEWQRDGVRISETFPYQGTTNDTLAIDRVLASDAGLYRCAVRGGCGEMLSAAITLAGVVSEAPVLQAILATGSGQSGVRLTWESPGSALERAPALQGPWTPIPGAVSPHEVRSSDVQGFFRLVPPQ